MTTAVAAQLVAVAACLLGLAGGWVCDVLARKERKPLSRIGVTVSAIASLSLAYLAINPIHAAPAIPSATMQQNLESRMHATWDKAEAAVHAQTKGTD